MEGQSLSPYKLALQKFKSNFWGVFSLVIIGLIGCIAIFAYVLAPDSTPNANQMHLSIHSKPPGFSTLILTIPRTMESETSLFHKTFFGSNPNIEEIAVNKYWVQDKKLFYIPYSEDENYNFVKQIDLPYPKPSKLNPFVTQKKFWLGTDKYGRDLLSRTLIGSRVSFFIGFIAVGISVFIGMILGSLGGYFGGKIDALIMWVINVTWSIPTLILVMAITLALGKGIWQVFIAVGLTMWVEIARVCRGEIIKIKQLPYITATKALGYSHLRIVMGHIWPNLWGPIIVMASANFAAAILIESGLNFLGIGAQPPIPTWGNMIKDHYAYIIVGKPYLALVPGFCIMILVLSFIMMGNALRDAFDVKS